MRWLAASAVVAALALGGCGQGDPSVSDTATAALEPHVAQIRLAAAVGDAAEVQVKLTELRNAVAVLREQGELSESGAAAILREAEGVNQQVALITTTTVKPPPATAPQGGERDSDRGKGKGDEKGNGDAHDD